MSKQCVKWKPVRKTNIVGREFDSEIPSVLDTRYRGTLLATILAMPKKNDLSFDQAIRMISVKLGESFDARQFGYLPGQYNWYLSHFAEWISEQGYHIELTGDEFESYALSDNV